MIKVLSPLHDHHGEGRGVIRGLPMYHGADCSWTWKRFSGLSKPKLLNAVTVVWRKESEEWHEG